MILEIGKIVTYYIIVDIGIIIMIFIIIVYIKDSSNNYINNSIYRGNSYYYIDIVYIRDSSNDSIYYSIY